MSAVCEDWRKFFAEESKKEYYRNLTVKVKEEYDSVFREADINTPLEFLFRDRWDPIKKPNNRSNSAKLTVISQEEGINSLGDFKNVFSNNKTSSNQLRFSLLNLLK